MVEFAKIKVSFYRSVMVNINKTQTQTYMQHRHIGYMKLSKATFWHRPIPREVGNQYNNNRTQNIWY